MENHAIKLNDDKISSGTCEKIGMRIRVQAKLQVATNIRLVQYCTCTKGKFNACDQTPFLFKSKLWKRSKI